MFGEMKGFGLKLQQEIEGWMKQDWQNVDNYWSWIIK